MSKQKNDQYLAIWVLSKLGWTNRRIARLRLPTSHHTVSDYYSEGCELINSGELPILAKSEKALRIFSAGKSDDVAYLYSKIYNNQCGGGKQVKQINYDDEEQD